MSARDFMRRVDARIFNSRIVRDYLVFGTNRIPGAFERRSLEMELPAGAVSGEEITFACQYQAGIATLAEGDTIEIEGHGDFRFMRERLPGGDESGLTILVLGEKLA